MTSMPKRIQRSRARGWRMPEGAVYVGRPTKWGNPFRSYAPDEAVRLYRTAVMGAMPIAFAAGLVRHVSIIELANARIETLSSLPLAELRGRDLACWCGLCDRHKDGKPLGVQCPDCRPCHADVLIELANAREGTAA
jgi:hypothetical protein